MAYDCFLSYASHDLAHAEAIYARLKDAGFTVWFDKARLDPGCDWHREIEQGCENSRVVLPLLTPRWKLSEWTRYETYGAEAVIPLLVEGNWPDVSTPPLTPYQSFTVPIPASGEADWQRLFNSIRELRGREAPQKAERVQHLRYRPAACFVGREKELEEIHEKLFTNPTAALTQGHVEAIAALGGVGKTTLARQYAEKFWRCYPQMFWADCRRGLETEFAAIHDILRREPVYAALSNKDKAGWVRYEFSQSANRPRRLLILDNAEDEESVLDWIPKTGNCHTLITSRFTGWSPGIETYRVWVLDPEPARELLLRRSARTDTPAERGACDALAKKLEYLPLALEQAAAYVGAQPPGWGFAQYLRLYEANERTFLLKKTPGATEYPDSVYLTWRATIDKLPQGARAILRMHAFLASTPTPVAMFVRGVDWIAKEARLIAEETSKPVDGDIEGAGELAVREWVPVLAKYSMAQLQPNDSFSVHGLVHAVEWHALAEKRAGALERTTELFLAYAERPSWEPASRRMWDVLLPHAVRLNEIYENLGLPQSIHLLDHIWRAFHARGDYRAAIPPSEKCLLLRELKSGPDHSDTLTSISDLAFLMQANGDYVAAEPLCWRALEARDRVLGPDDPDTLESVNNLAALLDSKGDYGAAEPLYRRALEARERVLGPEHPNTLNSLNNLGALMYSEGDYAAAEPLFRHALEARERVLGAEHPDTLTTLRLLADLLAETDRPQDSAVLRKAYIARMAAKEESAPPLELRQLAFECYQDGDYTHAEQLLRRVLEAHFEVPSTHCLLARVLLLMNRDKEAQSEVEKACENRADWQPYTAQRVYFFQALFALLNGTTPTEALRNLRKELLRPDAMQEWDLKRLLDHLKPRLTPEACELIEALSAAINDRSAMERLETLPAWRAIL
jgi:Tfp pilus assembly protein PilF